MVPFSESKGCRPKAECWCRVKESLRRGEGCTHKGPKGAQGELGGAPTLSAVTGTVLGKDRGLPVGALAWLILSLCQPSAALRNRVWNSGPVSVADFTSGSPFSIEKEKPERALHGTEHPMLCDVPWLQAHPRCAMGWGGIHPGLQRAVSSSSL